MLQFIFPYVPGCFGACAQTPGPISWYNGYSTGGFNGPITARVLYHESMHNLGIHHSSFNGKGVHSDYGDTTDLMGHGDTHINAAYQHYLGWLGDEDVQVVRKSGKYRIYAHDAGMTLTDDGIPTPSGYVEASGAHKLKAIVMEKDCAFGIDSGCHSSFREFYYAAFRAKPMTTMYQDFGLDFSHGLTVHRYQRHSFFYVNTGHRVHPAAKTWLEHTRANTNGADKGASSRTNDAIEQRDAWLDAGATFASERAPCVLSHDGVDTTTHPHSILVTATCDFPTATAVSSIATTARLTTHYVVGESGCHPRLAQTRTVCLRKQSEALV